MPGTVDLTSMAEHPLCHIVTPIGMLGYGFDEDQTASAVASLASSGLPTALILDSGSTDSGPSKLALGSMTTPRSAYVKDLTKLLRLVHRFKVPLIFSSAGGDGSDEHVEEMLGVIHEIAAAEETNGAYHFKVIAVYSGIDKAVVMQSLEAGQITPCGASVPQLNKTDVQEATLIVAQMGPEPLVSAMEAEPDFDIVVAGRTYDPAPYVAYATVQLNKLVAITPGGQVQDQQGGFTHMGKIMECGGVCATPKSHGATATVYPSGVFDISPLDPLARCTPTSVAAHALYENARPDILNGPGGSLHLQQSTYQQLEDGRTVRVRGAVFRKSQSDGTAYRLKLEGARVSGYRSVFMGSISDPILLGQIDHLLARVTQYVGSQHPDNTGQWDLGFHVYGNTPHSQQGPRCACFLVGEAKAPTQKLANSIASKARVAVIHGSYPGQKATAGNFGFGIGGLTEIEAGPCAEFCVYHLMDLKPGQETLSLPPHASGQEQPCALLRHEVIAIGSKAPKSRPDDGTQAAVRMPTKKALVAPSASQTNGTAVAPLKAPVPAPVVVLGDLAQVLRSKNAGPFDITIDIMFSSERVYELVKSAELLTATRLAGALGVSEADLVWSGFFDAALAFKVTIPRVRGGTRRAAGGFMEDDVHGTQQHVGIFNMPLPQTLIQALSEIENVH